MYFTPWQTKNMSTEPMGIRLGQVSLHVNSIINSYSGCTLFCLTYNICVLELFIIDITPKRFPKGLSITYFMFYLGYLSDQNGQ